MLNKYFYRKVTINYSNLRASSRPSRSSRLIFKATIIQKNDIIKQLMESYLAKEMLKSRQRHREEHPSVSLACALQSGDYKEIFDALTLIEISLAWKSSK